MPRVCTVCTHPDKEAIDKALVDGEAIRKLSAIYSVSEFALARHRDNHLPATLKQGQQAGQVLHADNLLDQMRGLQEKVLSILGKAETAGDLKVALQAIREARGNLELLAKLQGELQEGQTVNILVIPEWITLRSTILRALEPYPDARLAIVEALHVT